MKDALKIRYFNQNTKNMVYPNCWRNIDAIYECLKQQITFDINSDYPIKYDFEKNGIIFTACTGIKDENGDFLYEGDIVEFQDDNTTVTGTIKQNETNSNLYIDCGCLDGLKFDYELNVLETANAKIIGNIYENPELIGV